MCTSELQVKSLAEFIWDLEKKYDLLDWQVKGIAPWPLVRMRVFDFIAQKTGLLGVAVPSHRNIRYSLSLLASHIVAFATNNAFFAPRKRFILFPHPRKVNGKEIYSDRLIRAFGKDLLIIDTKIDACPLDGSYRIDFMESAVNYFVRLHKILSRFVLDEKDEAQIRTIGSEIEDAFQHRLELKEMIVKSLVRTKLLGLVYELLFRLKKPERVFVLIAYARQEITLAAKRAGIPVTELQHGTITPYHFGYSYPGRPEVANQPDEFLCFGRFWHEHTDLPRNLVPRVIGSPFVRENSLEKDNSLVLISSSGIIGQRLLEFTVKAAVLRPDKKFIFQIHPCEKKDRYLKFEDLNSVTNFLVSSPQDNNTYDLMRRALYHVGVSSTTLYEGMVLGCRTVLIKLPSYEYLLPAVAKKDAIIVSAAEELAEKLESAPLCASSDDYYAAPVGDLSVFYPG